MYFRLVFRSAPSGSSIDVAYVNLAAAFNLGFRRLARALQLTLLHVTPAWGPALRAPGEAITRKTHRLRTPASLLSSGVPPT